MSGTQSAPGTAEPLYASQASWEVNPRPVKRSRRHPAAESSEARLGQILGSYRLLEVLGLGGMGTVYRAEHIKLGREVALKLLHDDYAQRRDAVSRFFQEARAVNKIRHRNIVDISDLVELPDGTTFLVMELLSGVPLTALMRGEGGLETPRALAILLQICDGLAAAHAVGIVHRDLKPDNVFIVVTPDGADEVKLVDFGVAKLIGGDHTEIGAKTVAGAVIGTPAFMSPEQAGGLRVDARSDVYSLGAIMYEMFTGAPMFRGKSFGDFVRKHLSEQPIAPRRTRGGADMDPELEEIILTCLKKSPTERYASAQALRVDLLSALARAGGTDPETAEELLLPSAPESARGQAEVEPATMPIRALAAEEPTALAPSSAGSSPAIRPMGHSSVSGSHPGPPSTLRTPQPYSGQPTPSPTPGAWAPPYPSSVYPSPSGASMPAFGRDTALTAGDLPRDPTQHRPPWRLPLFLGGGLALAAGLGVALYLASSDRGEESAMASEVEQPAEEVSAAGEDSPEATPLPIVKPMADEPEPAGAGRLVTVRFVSEPQADLYPSGSTEVACTTPCDLTIDPTDGGSPRRRDFFLRRSGFETRRVTVNLRSPRDVIELTLERSSRKSDSRRASDSRQRSERTSGAAASRASKAGAGDGAEEPPADKEDVTAEGSGGEKDGKKGDRRRRRKGQKDGKKDGNRAYDPEDTLNPFGS